MKHIRFSAALLALSMLPLAACSDHSSSEPMINESGVTAETTTAPTETASSVTTVSLPPLHWETSDTPLHLMQCFRETGIIDKILPAGGTNVLVSVRDERNRFTNCVLMDMAGDKVLAKYKIDDPYADVIGFTPDEKIVYMDFQGAQILIFADIYTGESTKINLEGGGWSPEYNRAADTVSNCGEGAVQVIHRDGTIEKVFQAYGDDSRLYAVDKYFPEENLMLTEEPDNNDYTGKSYVLRTLDDQKLLGGIPTISPNAYLTKSCLLRSDSFKEQDGSYGTALAVFSRNNGSLLNLYDLEGEVRTASNAETVLVIDWGSGPNGSDIPWNLWMLDPVSGKRAVLDFPEGRPDAFAAGWLPECGSWAVGRSIVDESVYYSEIYAVDAENAVFADSFPEHAPYADLKEISVGPTLKECRERADRIEKELGIRILLGNEVLRVQEGSGYLIVSSEDTDAAPTYFESFTLEDVAATVSEELDELEREYRRYPAGFFEKFKQKDGSGGLRILMTLDLRNYNNTVSFVPGGVQFNGPLWYNIAINLTMMSAIHHETWHAVESLLDANSMPFDYTEWIDRFNPPGSEYFGLDEFGAADWDYIMNFTDDPYYVRSYSTVSPMEDRATIVESMFETLWGDDAARFNNGLEMIMSYPHIAAKADFMAERVKKLFGYVYWEEILEGTVHRGSE